MTHFGVIQHSSLTGGLLEGTGTIAPDPNVSPLDFFRLNPPDLGTLKESFNLITQFNEPKVSTDLFDRIRTNIASAFTSAREERTNLGEASVDISNALNRQIAIRESQRAETLGIIDRINERLTQQVTDLGKNLPGGDINPIDGIVKFFTDNPILSGFSLGSLAVGGIVLLLLLRK